MQWCALLGLELVSFIFSNFLSFQVFYATVFNVFTLDSHLKFPHELYFFPHGVDTIMYPYTGKI